MTATHCPYCALQCAMTVTPTPHGARVEPRDFPTNRSGLCRKGWTSAELLRHDERITSPLRRIGDRFHPVSWTDALDDIAGRLLSIRAERGPDAVGVFGGGGLTNEKAYQLGKFARVALRTSRIDYNGRFCMSSAAAAGNRAFGIDRGLPFPVTDLDDADTILLLGSNVAATMPPLLSHLAAARAAGGLIVVDPRRSETARLTDDGGGTHVQPAPGSDLIVLLGLTHVVFAEGLADLTYLAARTNGAEELRRSVGAWWPERVQTATGVPAAQLRAVARRLAQAPNTFIITGRGVEQHIDGTDTTTAAINLSLALGLPGTHRAGYGTLTGQSNGQGGREHGQKCDQLPGYRKIADPAARAHVARVWGVDPDDLPGPGVPAMQLIGMLGTEVSALLVHGSNVVVSAPDATVATAALAALDLLVVCDFFLSETARLAHYVLPVTQWAEEEGTMTSLEGRVIRRRRSLPPPGETRSELWIMRELALRLGAAGTWSAEAREVFDELARASAGGIADYSGLSHELLDTGIGAYWPYPTGSAGTPRLFQESFAHPDGRALIVPVTPGRGDHDTTGNMTLVTGRLMEHYQSGAQTRRVAELMQARPEVTVQLHPAAAADLGISADDLVDITNERGTVRARAEITRGIRHDTVFLPFHYPGTGSANRLTEAAVDPHSAMPEFKRTRVTVSRSAGQG